MITSVRPLFGDSLAISMQRDGGRLATITLSRNQALKLATQLDRALVQQDLAKKQEAAK
jgi:hypothetical protein